MFRILFLNIVRVLVFFPISASPDVLHAPRIIPLSYDVTHYLSPVARHLSVLSIYDNSSRLVCLNLIFDVRGRARYGRWPDGSSHFCSQVIQLRHNTRAMSLGLSYD